MAPSLQPYVSQVLSSQLQWIPQGEQAERFRDAPIRPVHDDILLAKLKPGQEIELEAWCEKGVGWTHRNTALTLPLPLRLRLRLRPRPRLILSLSL